MVNPATLLREIGARRDERIVVVRRIVDDQLREIGRIVRRPQPVTKEKP